MAERVRGTPYNRLGVANRVAKNKKNEIHHCLWMAANQQWLIQQPTKNRPPQRRGVWRGCAPVGRHGGKRDTIILGALEVGRLIKTQINH
jgi:hypothetical protein